MSTRAPIQLLQHRHAAEPTCRSFLVWGFVALTTTVALLALRPPATIATTAPLDVFSAERAMLHVRVIAAAPHPIGSIENQKVREYLMAQLSGLGFNPQVFRGFGVHNSKSGIAIGQTYDVVGRLAGTANSRAIMLVAHYDSVYRAPGAADDGSGVAAILETVRALRSRQPLKNDVIVLFTDGEEAGLLGADAFAAAHPWLHDVGLIMNFEARGNQGPALLFESGPSNRRLLQAVTLGASYPLGSSLFYALYKLLPNDTDFTVFRQQNVTGLNFAFGENLEAYHSRLDNASNLSPSSLQHVGSYALDLTRQFGQMNLTELTTEGGDDVFFDWYGTHLIAYGQFWVIPGEILVSILLFAVVALSVQRREVRKAKILPAALYSTLFLVLVPTVLSVSEWIISHALAAHLIVADSRANSMLLTGFVLLGACAATLLFTYCRGRFTVYELFLAGLIIVLILSWIIAILLPAGSYVLFWPLSLITVGLLVTSMGKSSQRRALDVIGFFGVIATVFLFAPIVYLLYVFLTLQLITVLCTGLLIALFFILTVPVIDIAAPQARSRTGVIILLCSALISIAAGVTFSGISPSHPKRNSILYSMNADAHKAAWISYDQSLDSWTQKIFSNSAPSRLPAPDYLGGSSRPVLWAPTLPFDLPPPTAEIESEEQKGNTRKVRMKIRSGRAAAVISLIFAKGNRPLSVKTGGRDTAFIENSGSNSVRLFGIGPEGVLLEFTFGVPSKITFWLMDQTFGLPTPVEPRSDEYMASDGSDITLVCRKYDL